MDENTIFTGTNHRRNTQYISIAQGTAKNFVLGIRDSSQDERRGLHYTPSKRQETEFKI